VGASLLLLEPGSATVFFFYGNKLFLSQFITVLSLGNKSVLTGWLWNLVSAGLSLCGYYLASFLIDTKFVGRKQMQQLGFLVDFILFVVPAFHYNYYAKEKANIAAFQPCTSPPHSSISSVLIARLSLPLLRCTQHPYEFPLAASRPLSENSVLSLPPFYTPISLPNQSSMAYPDST
jgi:hypothetical protein